MQNDSPPRHIRMASPLQGIIHIDYTNICSKMQPQDIAGEKAPIVEHIRALLASSTGPQKIHISGVFYRVLPKLSRYGYANDSFRHLALQKIPRSR